MKYTNTFKTVFFLVLLSALFMSIGYMAGGKAGMFFALMMSFFMNFGAYWFSDKIVLAMHDAKPLNINEFPDIHEMVKELTLKAGIPMPKLYIVPGKAPNAFATGRNPENAAVAVTEGLLNALNRNELKGVLAHELSHVMNRDILVSTVAASIASAIMYLSHMLQWFGIAAGGRDDDNRGVNPVAMIVTVLLAPLAATLIQAAVSRSREYMADESGAGISGDPEGLASALQKISHPRIAGHNRDYEQFSGAQSAVAHMYIVNNLRGESILNLFSTHPPVKERIKRLRNMKRY